MSRIIFVLLYILTTISNALESNYASLDNGARQRRRIHEYLGEEELQYVVSVGFLRDGNYEHICMAVMITGLNGITAGKCGHNEFYANKAKLNQSEENHGKLYVNTKRTELSHPDTLYSVVRFIDFRKYLLEKPEDDRLLWYPNIGVIVLGRKVQYTRPLLDVPISRIRELPMRTAFTLIGWNYRQYRQGETNLLMKKQVLKIENSYCQTAGVKLRAYQFCVGILSFKRLFLSKYDLGGPVYWNNQFVGILVDSRLGLVVIDAYFERHIDEIIASTWIPLMKEREPKRKTHVHIGSSNPFGPL